MSTNRWSFLRDHVAGMTDAEIAAKHGVSRQAVTASIARAMRSAGCRNRCQLGAWAAEKGIVLPVTTQPSA